MPKPPLARGVILCYNIIKTGQIKNIENFKKFNPKPPPAGIYGNGRTVVRMLERLIRAALAAAAKLREFPAGRQKLTVGALMRRKKGSGE